MPTHDHGELYVDWRKAEAGLTALVAEIGREQVSHPVADYTEERVERLVDAMQQAARWTSPPDYVVNV